MGASNDRDSSHTSSFNMLAETWQWILICIAAVAISLSCLLFAFSLFPSPPNLNLSTASATPFSYINDTASWKFTVDVANLANRRTIGYDHICVSVFYVGGSGRVLMAEKFLANRFVQKTEAQTKLQLELSVSGQKLGSKDSTVIGRIIEDQKRGMVRIQVSVSFLVQFIGDGERKRMMEYICSPSNIIFENESRSGMALDLPQECEYIFGHFR